MEQGNAKPFEPLQLNYEKWEEIKQYINKEISYEDSQRVKNLIQFISGFTSELSLEILATVDFIITQNPKYSIDDVTKTIENWNMRKKELFKPEYVEASYNYLKNYTYELFA